MIVEVYDIEVLSNLFTYTGYNRQTGEYHQFVIHKLRNDYEKLITHLRRRGLVQVGYNNVNYDYPVLHHLIRHYNDYSVSTGQEIAQCLFKKSQEIIATDFSAVASKNELIPQIDVYKINHWDNAARACSLKHCEFAMGMDSIEEMPLHFTHWVTKQDEIDMILAYVLCAIK